MEERDGGRLEPSLLGALGTVPDWRSVHGRRHWEDLLHQRLGQLSSQPAVVRVKPMSVLPADPATLARRLFPQVRAHINDGIYRNH